MPTQDDYLHWYWGEVRLFLYNNGINPNSIDIIKQEVYFLTWEDGFIEPITPAPFSQN